MTEQATIKSIFEIIANIFQASKTCFENFNFKETFIFENKNNNDFEFLFDFIQNFEFFSFEISKLFLNSFNSKMFLTTTTTTTTNYSFERKSKNEQQLNSNDDKFNVNDKKRKIICIDDDKNFNFENNNNNFIKKKIFSIIETNYDEDYKNYFFYLFKNLNNNEYFVDKAENKKNLKKFIELKLSVHIISFLIFFSFFSIKNNDYFENIKKYDFLIKFDAGIFFNFLINFF
jgi:hypothetical protein